MPLTQVLLSLLLGCAAPPDARLLAEALSPALPVPAALLRCDSIASPATADECRAGVVRGRAAEDDAQAAAACARTEDPRWSGECWFTLAEARIARAERWPALEACGRAGPFYDECLYHLWSAEMSENARQAPDAVSAALRGQPLVDFWSGLQTLAGDPAEQVTGDLWFFAWNEHRPADLEACDSLEEPVAGRCRKHTATFVLRALLGELLSPSAPAGILDRTCRSGQVPDAALSGLFRPHPDLDAQVARAAELACRADRGEPVRRWNPVFQARRPLASPP